MTGEELKKAMTSLQGGKKAFYQTSGLYQEVRINPKKLEQLKLKLFNKAFGFEFKDIVDDKVAPSGIKPADRIDFYKAVLLGKNPKIKIQEKQEDGKVKFVQKPFNEIFTEEERASYREQYLEQEKVVAKKLKVLDEALQKNYSDKMGGDALWRKYVKHSNKQ
jgi:hypothetical protein